MFIIEEGEKIIKIVRRHYFVILPMALTILVATLAPTFLYLFLISGFLPLAEGVKPTIEHFVREWGTFGYTVWLLILWIMFFIEWTDYYLDIWIITDKRIIDVEQNGFFHREVTSFNYNQIQDITIETHGLLETFLKFGTLHIQTAGHNRNIIIKDAHYPEEARSIILGLQQKLSFN
jgi:membrane protein YdbS with pleckstrin-like domain